MSGIDVLIYSPIVTVLKEKAVEIMQREKMTAETLIPTSPSFSRGAIVNLVMELLQAIPEATDGKISAADVQTLITSVMGGGGIELPASFGDVFSPDMIDMDCIDFVTELPGLGDAFGPIMASMEGELTGKTGAKSPFGAVKKPAWLTRD